MHDRTSSEVNVDEGARSGEAIGLAFKLIEAVEARWRALLEHGSSPNEDDQVRRVHSADARRSTKIWQISRVPSR